MQSVTLTATTMGFSVAVNHKGEIRNTSLNIGDYAKKFIHNKWDKVQMRWVTVNEYLYFDSKNETCYFPRYELPKFIDFLTQHRVMHQIVERPPVKGTPVEFHMAPWVDYKNEKQRGAVEFLTNPLSGSIRGLGLQTGTGKTVSAIWAMQKLGVRSMITMTSRLEQWVGELIKYTTLDEDDIFVIQGVGSLTKLFSLIDKDLKPKVILGSTKTIRLYIDYGPTYQHLPHPSEMCEKLGIGICLADEAHEHFYTNFLMGLFLNPAVFIPITATFLANDPFVKSVFDQFFPVAIQFEGGAYDKYVNVTAYQYTSGGFSIKPFHYMSPQGYSQVMFEKFLMGRGRKVLDALIDDAVIPIVRNHYINIAEKGERFLMLCATTKLCDHLEGVFKRVFKDKTVSTFYSGMPVTTLERFDMILSTPGSAGTGRDVKNLRTCFAFENSGSETRNLQFLGRLRGPPQMMNTPEFTYVSLSAIPQHQKYHNARAMLYGSRALTFKHRTLS